jgi:hypothetical protein
MCYKKKSYFCINAGQLFTITYFLIIHNTPCCFPEVDEKSIFKYKTFNLELHYHKKGSDKEPSQSKLENSTTRRAHK